jgi:hypothetical protein
MKTRLYISTLLALTIQVMVNGQTPGNQATKGDYFGMKLNYQDEATVKEDKVAVKTTLTTQESAENLKQQAEDLILKSKYLREAAVNNTGLTKTELLEESNTLYKQAEMMMITALELSGVKNQEAFKLNKAGINQLLEKANLSAVASKQAQSLISDAEMNMRYAYEMREEANAMPTLAGKLGSLSNADEKETLALGEQNQALNILKGFAYHMAGVANTLATK